MKFETFICLFAAFVFSVACIVSIMAENEERKACEANSNHIYVRATSGHACVERAK